MRTDDQIAIVLLTPMLFVVVVAFVVIAGVLYCAWAKRNDAMDPDQARVFAHVRPSVAARVWTLFAEIAYQSLSLLMRTVHAFGVMPPLRGQAGCTPVLVVPGYTENAGTMWLIGWRLARAGFNPILIDFPSTLHRIESNVEFLAQRIAQIRAAAGGVGVAVVAHSMGGLVTRTLIHSREEHGVTAFVAISSPFRGTHTAELGTWLRLGHCLPQMRPDSEFMQRFPPSLPAKVPLLSMIACQENIVSPEWSAVVAGADTRVLSQPWGHQAPLFLTEVYVQVEQWLLDHGVTRRRD